MVQITLGRNKHRIKKSVQLTSGANTFCLKKKTRRICNSYLQNNFQGCHEWVEICINLHTFEFKTLFPFHKVVHLTEFFNQSGKQKGIVLCVEKVQLQTRLPKNAEGRLQLLFF
ncbi:hypothetical protein CDAR_216651 [Caerostris darwini]|uniref:Uncharacterized protein n=1 Tax=Caerostris darwini TaxID=1538125 RepID=A0AAV4QSF1_9ARAC|nr:hypothetical protein CDAR_216651 [Caerostris darwini]